MVDLTGMGQVMVQYGVILVLAIAALFSALMLYDEVKVYKQEGSAVMWLVVTVVLGAAIAAMIKDYPV